MEGVRLLVGCGMGSLSGRPGAVPACSGGFLGCLSLVAWRLLGLGLPVSLPESRRCDCRCLARLLLGVVLSSASEVVGSRCNGSGIGLARPAGRMQTMDCGRASHSGVASDVFARQKNEPKGFEPSTSYISQVSLSTQQ